MALNVDDKSKAREAVEQLNDDERDELNEKVHHGETVVPGGTGGKSLEAQANLAAGRSKGGSTRRDQIGTEGYKEMGKKGGLSTMDQSGGERAAEQGVQIDESKYSTRSRQPQSH